MLKAAAAGKKMMMQDAGLCSILDPIPVQDMQSILDNMAAGDFITEPEKAAMEPSIKKRKLNEHHPSMVQIPSSIPDTVQHDVIQNIFNSGTPVQNVEPKSLQNTLEQIEQDVTTIMSSIAQKKPKVTLHQLNTKLDFIISILMYQM